MSQEQKNTTNEDGDRQHHSARPKKKAFYGRRRQIGGMVFGLFSGFILFAVLSSPQGERYRVRGPLNSGHEELKCASCHSPAPGSIRQQLQAKVKHLFGMRKTGADFGRVDVGNDACLACHQRPNDRHPVFRFLEPRFKEARAAIQPQTCNSCHLEHSGKRVTIQPTYCSNCHGELEMKKDPLTVSHQVLVAQARWETCLGCHDFHGNHNMKTETVVEKATPIQDVLIYFNGGRSPYPAEKFYVAPPEVPQ